MSKYIKVIQSTTGDAQIGKKVELVPKGGAYPGDIIASTTGTATVLITDAGNGVYYTNDAALPSGDYDVYVEGSKEVHESPHFHPEDAEILTKADVVDDVISTDSDLPLSAKQGKELNDKTVANTKSGGDLVVTTNPILDMLSIVNNLTSGGTQVPGSAEQLKVLKAITDLLALASPGGGLENVGSTNQLKAKVLGTDIDIDENDYLYILQEFANQQILLNGKTLNQNLERLQSKILAIQDGLYQDGGIRVLHSDNIEDTAPSAILLADKVYSTTGAANYECKRIYAVKQEGESELKISFLGKTSTSTSCSVTCYVKDSAGLIITSQPIALNNTAYAQKDMTIGISSLVAGEIYTVSLYLLSVTNTLSIKGINISVVI